MVVETADTGQTLDWHVMQDPKDATKFCIVERYEKESSQEYHLNNPVREPAFDPCLAIFDTWSMCRK